MRECVRVGGEGYAVRGSVPIVPAWRVRDISAVVGPTMKSSEAIGGLLDDLGSLMDPSVGYVVRQARPAGGVHNGHSTSFARSHTMRARVATDECVRGRSLFRAIRRTRRA